MEKEHRQMLTFSAIQSEIIVTTSAEESDILHILPVLVVIKLHLLHAFLLFFSF